MSEFPKKISENGWYELSDGTTVRGEEAAREAEQDLQAVADEEELVHEESEEDPTPSAQAADEEDLNPQGKKCANCGREATVVDNPPTANPVFYCDQDRPVYLR